MESPDTRDSSFDGVRGHLLPELAEDERFLASQPLVDLVRVARRQRERAAASGRPTQQRAAVILERFADRRARAGEWDVDVA